MLKELFLFRILKSGSTGLGGSLWLGQALSLLIILQMVGCTSDTPSEVGTDLVDQHIDVVLEPLVIDSVERYTGKDVSEADLPLAEQEVLYLGSQGGNSSSILLNYDFSDIYSEGFPEEAWTEDNIQWVKLRFLMLEYYGHLLTVDEEEKADKALAKIYQVHELTEPFDPESFPGPEPEFSPTDLNNDSNLDDSEFLEISIDFSWLEGWVEAGQEQGLIVREGDGSVEGLSGFSSKEMKHAASSLIDYDEFTLVAPVIKVHFVHNDSTFLLEPTADISSFHQLNQASEDMSDKFMMRTCLRSYPMMRFDFSSLPANAIINRAVLAVTNDTTSSFGNLQSVVVSEIDTEYFETAGDTLSLTDLEGAVYSISGMVNLDPVLNDYLEFNVTTARQRIVNSVYEGDRGFILTAGEDFLPSYDVDAMDPDFFFTQFEFFGTSAADSLRPHLNISYSSIEEINGGEN